MSVSPASRPPPGPGEVDFEIEGFRCESGETIPTLRIRYAVAGRMSAARDNVVLVMPGTSHARDGAAGLVGPGRAFDTDRWCVVRSDGIGAGDSTQPSDGLAGAFPRYGIRDMVRAQMAFVRHGLGLGGTPLAAVAGASMGAFQSLEWAILEPDSVRRAILLVPASRAGAMVRMAVRRMRETIELDPLWREGRYTRPPRAGLGLAGRQFFVTAVSDAYIESCGDAIEAQARASGERFAAWDAWGLIRRYEASAAHDVAVPHDGDAARALGRVSADVLLLPCRQDRLLGIDDPRRMARAIRRAHLAEIDSPLGHLAWRPVPGSPETRFVADRIRDFMG